MKRTLTASDELSNIFNRWCTTPNILTEVSNLLGQLPDGHRELSHAQLAKIVDESIEEYLPISEMTRLPHFGEFGLTDTTLFRLASRGALVITTDFRLNDLLIRYQYPSLNFNNIRFEDL